MKKLLLGIMWACLCPALFSANLDVTKFRAVGDGITMNTAFIQRAIDECSLSGGGEVRFPAGTFLTGTLYMKDNVTLSLSKNTVLLGSTNLKDYPEQDRIKAVIYAKGVNNISIKGEGEINGNGHAFYQGDNAPNRPTLLLLDKCKKVRVEDVQLGNSAFWSFRLLHCDGVIISKVNIYGHCNWNNDGFDVESRNVTISDCIVNTDDDALCFKNEDPGFMVENITVTNCIFSSNCNFIKFGTASYGGFRNIAISNCALYKAAESNLRSWEKIAPGVTQPITGIAGIALEVVDGGFMEQISITNLVMEDVQTPVFIRLGARNTGIKPSYLRNILISGITATSQSFIASSITGVPGLTVENVVLRDLMFTLKGGGKVEDAMKTVPEMEKAYPENRMFETMLPAYGFYLRHASNITMDNVQLRTHSGQEERHAIVAEDVNLLRIMNAVIEAPQSKLSPISLKACTDVHQVNNIIQTKKSVK